MKQRLLCIILTLALLFTASVSAAFVSYRYPYYNFKIDTATGALVNMTVDGQSTPVFLNLTSQYFNVTGGRYTIIGTANISIYLNTSLMDMIIVSYAVGAGGRRSCIVNDTWRFFEDNQTFYVESQVEAAGSNTCYLYKHKYQTYTNSPNYFDRLQGTTTNTWRGAAFAGSNTFKSNFTVKSGTCSNGLASSNNESYLMVLNTSRGWLLAGSTDCSSAMSIGYQSEFYSPSWFIADRNDSLELGTDVAQHDYIAFRPNKSMSVYDGATAKYLQVEVAYPGLAGYILPQGASFRLRPKTERRNVYLYANDFFRSHMFFNLQNATGKQSYRAPVQSFRSDAIQTTSGELSLIGGRYIIHKFHIYDGRAASFSKINITEYPTQAHLRADHNANSKLGMQTLLDHCLERLRIYCEHDGWWKYPDILNAIFEWGGDAYLGNAYESMYSCNNIIGNTWTDNHVDVRNYINNKWLDCSRAYKLNPRKEPEARTQRYTLRVDSTRGFEVNRSAAPTAPEWKAPAKNVTVNSGWYVVMQTNTGPESIAIRKINCNTTGGVRIWHDDFQTDTSANYNDTGWSYDSVYKRMLSTTRTATGANSIGPKNCTACSANWANIVCSFDIESVANLSGRVNSGSKLGYFIISIKRNSSVSLSYDNAVRYYYAGESTASFKFGARTGATWKFVNEMNETQGIYSTDWYQRNVSYANASAYIANNNPRNYNQTAMSPHIINQQLYFDLGVADSYYRAFLMNRSTNASYYSQFLTGIMTGYNWLNSKKPEYFRRDGFWQYSSQTLNHDDGYLTNSLYEQSKLQRAYSAMPRLADLPFACYYGGVGRANKSESTTTVDFELRIALLAMSDSRCAQYVNNKTGFTTRLASENKAFIMYQQEYKDEIWFVRSNCSHIFNNKIPIYYQTSHVIPRSNSSLMWNVKETCTNIRVKQPNGGQIFDAYQTNGTSSIYVQFLPINNVRHTWNTASAEAYPLGAYISTSPMWDFGLHRWKQNSTHYIYNTSSFLVSAAATVTLAYENALNSTDYTVAVNGIKKAGFTTDATGTGSTSFTTLAANSNVTITQETYTAGSNYHLVATNITNNTVINYSRMANYIGARFQSENITSDWLTLLVDGAFSTWKKVNNNTWTGFSAANITPGLRTIVISTDYNQTRQYVLNIRNTTGGNISAVDDEFTLDFPVTANSAIWGLLLVAIAVIVFMVVIPVIYGAANGSAIGDNILEPLLTIAVIILIAFIMLALASRVIG